MIGGDAGGWLPGGPFMAQKYVTANCVEVVEGWPERLEAAL
jgi:hypothetical protein